MHMTQYETKITIDRPADQVYALITDPNKATRWITGLQKIERLSGTPGDVGYQSKYTYLENGRTVVFFEKVTRITPGESFCFDIGSDDLELNVETQLKRLGHQTHVHMKNRIKGKSLKMKIMLPLLKGVMRRRQMKDLQNLKEILER